MFNFTSEFVTIFSFSFFFLPSGLLYILFAVLLGAVCTRYSLITDYMIASKVSLVGVLFLFGLYVSSLSSCLGAQYGAPRVLQCISKENVVPLIKPLGKGVSISSLDFAVHTWLSSRAKLWSSRVLNYREHVQWRQRRRWRRHRKSAQSSFQIAVEIDYVMAIATL